MTTLIGLGVIGGAVLVFAVVGLLANRRRIRQEAEAKRKGPDDARGATLHAWRHETGADWRQRP